MSGLYHSIARSLSGAFVELRRALRVARFPEVGRRRTGVILTLLCVGSASLTPAPWDGRLDGPIDHGGEAAAAEDGPADAARAGAHERRFVPHRRLQVY